MSAEFVPPAAAADGGARGARGARGALGLGELDSGASGGLVRGVQVTSEVGGVCSFLSPWLPAANVSTTTFNTPFDPTKRHTRRRGFRSGVATECARLPTRA